MALDPLEARLVRADFGELLVELVAGTSASGFVRDLLGDVLAEVAFVGGGERDASSRMLVSDWEWSGKLGSVLFARLPSTDVPYGIWGEDQLAAVDGTFDPFDRFDLDRAIWPVWIGVRADGRVERVRSWVHEDDIGVVGVVHYRSTRVLQKPPREQSASKV